jgi:hypothetical protein
MELLLSLALSLALALALLLLLLLLLALLPQPPPPAGGGCRCGAPPHAAPWGLPAPGSTRGATPGRQRRAQRGHQLA